MNLAATIRSAVAIADRTTNSLQDLITFYAWTGFGEFGEPTYAAPIFMRAIIEEKQRQLTLGNGQEVVQKASVTIPRPIAANGALERREPVDSRDKIVLPNGYTGPILDVSGVTDPSTHAPYMFTIILG